MANLSIDYTPNVDSQRLTASAGNNTITIKLGAPVLLTALGMRNSEGFNCMVTAYLRLNETASRHKNIVFIPYQSKKQALENWTWTGRQRIGSPYSLRFEYLTCTVNDVLTAFWATQEIE